MADHHFSESYSFETNSKSQSFSPYFDGESLLALIKAAKYLGFSDLIPGLDETATKLAKYYTYDQWQIFYDSTETKGFSQWGSMAFSEYSETTWKNSETFKYTTYALAWWLIYIHDILYRSRNTAYAYEGLLYAYKIALNESNNSVVNTLRTEIDKGLYKLTSWQVGGPLTYLNTLLKKYPTTDPLAVGGIMNGRQDPALRIDVTQHQMHTQILSLHFLYMKK